jgi:hypothetical protein
MPDFPAIVAKYRTKCEKLLKEAAPDGAEHLAYEKVLDAFEQSKARDEISFISSVLMTAKGIDVLELAPAELHTRANRAREIAITFVKDFIHETGHEALFH